MENIRAIGFLIAWLFWVTLLMRLVLATIASFARSWTPHGVTLIAAETVYGVTDPVVKPLRRIIPPLDLGGVRLDLTLMLLLLAVYFPVAILG